MKTAAEMNAIATAAQKAEEERYKEIIRHIIEKHIAAPVEAAAKQGLKSVPFEYLPIRFCNYHEEITAQLTALGYTVHRSESDSYYVIDIGWGKQSPQA